MRSRHTTGHGPENGVDEAARLDQAMRRADDLLVDSLQADERRRTRRRIILILLGGTAMLTVICLAWLGLGSGPQAGVADAQATAAVDAQEQRSGEQTDAVAVSNNAATDKEKAAQLSREGWTLWQRQAHGEAAEKFEESVRLNPRDANAWNGLGWASFNGGDVERAKEAFQKAIQLNPKHAAALNGIGQILLMQRDYEEAEKYLRKATAASPQAVAAWYGLARLYLLTENFPQAAKWVRKILDTGQGNETVERMLEAAEAKELPDDLRQLIEPPPVTEDEADQRQVARGWQLMNQGRRDEAKKVFEEILARSPDDTAALNGMGWLLLNGGDVETAKPYFERVLAAEPNATGSMNGLAMCLFREGETAKAIEIWEQMVETIPGIHAGTVNLADVYMQEQEYAKAIPLLEQLLKANPGDERYQKMLQRARAGLDE